MKNTKSPNSKGSRRFSRPSDSSKTGRSAESSSRSGDSRTRFSEKPKSYKPREKSERPAFGAKPSFAGKKPSKPPRPSVRPPSKEAPQLNPNATLIWGLHAGRAAFLNPERRIHRLWLTESGQKLFEKTQNEARDELLKRPDAKKSERDELDRMTPSSSVHQGILMEVAPLPDQSLASILKQDPPPDLILLLDQVTDPHNVGAILRSAAAFGAGCVVLTERNAPSATGVLAKSASGALEHTPLIHVVNLARTIDELREAGYWCIGLAEEGTKNLAELDMSGRTVLILGNEGEGLRHLTRQKCDELARLPTGGPVGSLNVSNAAAVALYEVRRQAK